MQIEVTSNALVKKDHGSKTATRVNREEPLKMEFPYEFGGSTAKAIELFGEDVVYSLFESQAVIAAQGKSRGMLDRGASVDEVQKAMAEWKPGVAPTRQPKDIGASVDKLIAQIKAMPDGVEKEAAKNALAEKLGLV